MIPCPGRPAPTPPWPIKSSRKSSANNQSLSQQLAWQAPQARQNELGHQAQAQSHIAGATPQPVAYPSQLALGLQLGGTALTAYDTAEFATGGGLYNANNYTGTGVKVPTEPLAAFPLIKPTGVVCGGEFVVRRILWLMVLVYLAMI